MRERPRWWSVWGVLLGWLLANSASVGAQWRVTEWLHWPRLEPARVRYWAERLRSDADPAQRLLAVRRLAEADPRVYPEVLPALIAALRYDSVAAIRQAAVETLGRSPVLFAQAGLALEEAWEHDASPAVRDAARQALWNYHLMGYQSNKVTASFLNQTPEPPLAQPTAYSRHSAASAATAPMLWHSEAAPSPSVRRWTLWLPPLFSPSARPAGVASASASLACPQGAAAGPPATPEPPLARPQTAPTAFPVLYSEPPIRPILQEPVRRTQPPPISDALPPLVVPPNEVPVVSVASPGNAQPLPRR
jgi:hypothetical protein